MRTAEQRQESLTRAVSGISLANYPAIYSGFEAMGIPADDIKPRENIFTFNAWKALGRYVRKGQHGVKIATFRTVKKTNRITGKDESYSCPWFTTVFHVSQTEALEAVAS